MNGQIYTEEHNITKSWQKPFRGKVRHKQVTHGSIWGCLNGCLQSSRV